MKNNKVYIFDLDGTLIESAHLVLDAINYATEPFQIQFTFTDIENIRTRSSHNLFDGFDLSKEDQFAALERLKDYSRSNIDRIKVFDGILDILRLLKSNNNKVAVWTGRDTYSANRILSHNNIDQYFDAVVGNTCVKNNKPDPEGLYKISSDLDVSTTDFIMIGDHDHDIIGGKAARTTTIKVDWGIKKFDESDKIVPDFRFKNVSELFEYIKKKA